MTYSPDEYFKNLHGLTNEIIEEMEKFCVDDIIYGINSKKFYTIHDIEIYSNAIYIISLDKEDYIVTDLGDFLENNRKTNELERLLYG